MASEEWYEPMIADPYRTFRRLAATFLNRLEAGVVERALSVPAQFAGQAWTSAKAAVSDDVQRAAAAVAVLRQLPHYLADMLADSWRGPNARVLTRNERLAIVDVFGVRARPEMLRIVDGAGWCAIAAAAFRNGNPAITVGNTIYLNPASKWPVRDLAVDNAGDDLELLIHEVTHTVQYRELGFAAFLARYGSDMAAARGDANEMYRYWRRSRPFDREMLEGQAEMVGNYTTLRNARDPKLQPRRTELRRRLSGTGYHGL